MLGKRGGIMSQSMILFTLLHPKEEVTFFFAIFFNMTFSLLYEINHFLRCISELEGKYNWSIKICTVLQYDTVELLSAAHRFWDEIVQYNTENMEVGYFGTIRNLIFYFKIHFPPYNQDNLAII
jgi:hypothetical protein